MATRMRGLLALLAFCGPVITVAADTCDWRPDVSALDWLTPHTLKDPSFRRQNTKPILLMFSSSRCGVCKDLLEDLDRSAGHEDFSKFVLVKVEGPSTQVGLGFEPDGNYVPRIMFADPNRRARPDLMHPRHPPSQKYYYGSAAEVLEGMQGMLAAQEGWHKNAVRS